MAASGLLSTTKGRGGLKGKRAKGKGGKGERDKGKEGVDEQSIKKGTTTNKQTNHTLII